MEILKKSGSFWKVPSAVSIPEYAIEQWVKECIEELKREPSLERAYMRSGNISSFRCQVIRKSHGTCM